MSFRGRFLLDVALNDKPRDDAAYPFALPAVRNLGRLALQPVATFFVGENGSGKSTLLEASMRSDWDRSY